MGRTKWSIKITSDALSVFNGGYRIAAARTIAEVVEHEFINMLKDAPQYSGNYVANMSLGTSGIARKAAEMPFKKDPDLAEAYSRGQTPAINKAIERNEGFVDKATAHITGKGGWLTELTVYNPLRYAEYVEANDRLRAENQGGEHALSKMAARLQSWHGVLNMRNVT